MTFERARWQKICRKKMNATRVHSYSKLAAIIKCSKSTLWNVLNRDNVNITVEDMLLISRILEVNPLDYIIVDEVQLKLL